MNLKPQKITKKHMLIVLLLLTILLFMIPFLQKINVEYCLNNQIKSYCSDLALTFPKASRTSYEEFLKTALGHVTFHVKRIEKKSDSLRIAEVSFQPVDMDKLLSPENLTYVKEMQTDRKSVV